MNKSLVSILLVLAGAVPLVLSVKRGYHLIPNETTWVEAQAYCRATYVDLATIETSDDFTKIQLISTKYGFTSATSFWIGMYYNPQSWRWSYKNESLGNFTKWNLPQGPSNGIATEECGAVTPTVWFNRKCTDSYYYVCFDDTKTGASRFIFIKVPMTWHGAQASCRATYTDLAIVRSAAENADLLSLRMVGYNWFGLIRDGWMWSDQSNAPLVTFQTGQPSNLNWYLNCGYLMNGLAYNAQCTSVMPFFCYSYPTRGQILKVKVQSIQDVNDPGTMEMILEQLTKKLRDNGNTNVTLTWRKHVDQKVFYKMSLELKPQNSGIIVTDLHCSV